MANTLEVLRVARFFESVLAFAFSHPDVF